MRDYNFGLLSQSYLANAQQQMNWTPRTECLHGQDCPVCRAIKESDEIAEQVKEKEYKERCEKYMLKLKSSGNES
jgi:hypothetical protein